MKTTLRSLCLTAAFATSFAGAIATGTCAYAQSGAGPRVKVENAWARASVAGQSASGAFMKLTAREKMRLVGVSSPAAGVAEVHEMKMDGSVMRMRPVAGIDLPARTAVELKPGGYHVMLMDLKAPLVAGTTVPVTFKFQDAKGADVGLTVDVPVSLAAPGAAAQSHGDHKH